MMFLAYLLYRSLENHPGSLLGLLRKLVKVQITVSINRSFIYLRHIGLVYFRRRQIDQLTMWMIFILIFDHPCKAMQHCFHIRFRYECNVLSKF
ncbi:hypothetical protein CHC80_24385 (plasmid) [Salmonella enterica subsp. enterica serovar Saintpaul]|nr:hypothetical protein CHC80_24385 [Salmonella enterica subsp. enterica serovar Saintpaul]